MQSCNVHSLGRLCKLVSCAVIKPENRRILQVIKLVFFIPRFENHIISVNYPKSGCTSGLTNIGSEEKGKSCQNQQKIRRIYSLKRNDQRNWI
jgi:hypothetical protein